MRRRDVPGNSLRLQDVPDVYEDDEDEDDEDFDEDKDDESGDEDDDDDDDEEEETWQVLGGVSAKGRKYLTFGHRPA